MINQFLKKSTFLLFLSAIFNCNTKTEFFKLENLKIVIPKNLDSKGQVAEYVVIANPTNNIDTLSSEILTYIYSNLDIHNLNLDQLSIYTCTFLIESRQTKKDFKNKSDFIQDNIQDHIDDIIAVLSYSDSQKWELKVKINNNPDKWKQIEFKF